MYRGQIIADLPNKDITKEQVGLMMAGVLPEEALAEGDQHAVEPAL
jgi:hypothetical protein